MKLTEWFVKYYPAIMGVFWAMIVLGLCLPCLVIFAGAILQN